MILFLCILCLPFETTAQTHNSLLGWEEDIRLKIQNRYQNYGGIFYDRGLFRFTTPPLTKEHDLDLITYNFTPAQQYDWYYNDENSFRTFIGSFDLGQFLHGAHIRNHITITDNLTMPLQFIKRYDMRTDRSLLHLSLNYQFLDHHQIGLRHLLNEQKPDLDMTLYYRLGELRTGGIEVSATAIDWPNNAIYNLGHHRKTDSPELRRYHVKPWLFHFKANTPVWEDVRVEMTGGVQTPLVSIGEAMPESRDLFRDRELARYFGVLLEHALPRFTTSLTFRHTNARFSRTRAERTGGEPVDYGNRQIQNSFGGFVGFRYRNFYSHNWIWRNYNRDRQWDHHETRREHDIVVYPFDYREFRWQMQFRLGYNLDQRGFTAALEWSSDNRKPVENYVISNELESRGLPYRHHYPGTIDLRNDRLTLQLGYRFSSRTSIVAGLSYDTDGDRYGTYWDRIERDSYARFDGGYLRLILYW